MKNIKKKKQITNYIQRNFDDKRSTRHIYKTLKISIFQKKLTTNN